MPLAFAISARRALSRLLGRFAFGGRRELHSRAPRLRKTNGDRLLRIAHAMFALPDLVNLRAHKFTSLCARGFSLAGVTPRAIDGPFIRHEIIFSPLSAMTSGRFRTNGHWKSLPAASRARERCSRSKSSPMAQSFWFRLSRAIAFPPRASARDRGLRVVPAP
jgi:hypothetical protein